MSVGGGVNTFTMGYGSGDTSASSESGGYAGTGWGGTNSGTFSQTGSTAASYGNVISMSSAGAGANSGASGSGWWWY